MAVATKTMKATTTTTARAAAAVLHRKCFSYNHLVSLPWSSDGNTNGLSFIATANVVHELVPWTYLYDEVYFCLPWSFLKTKNGCCCCCFRCYVSVVVIAFSFVAVSAVVVADIFVAVFPLLLLLVAVLLVLVLLCLVSPWNRQTNKTGQSRGLPPADLANPAEDAGEERRGLKPSSPSARGGGSPDRRHSVSLRQRLQVRASPTHCLASPAK